MNEKEWFAASFTSENPCRWRDVNTATFGSDIKRVQESKFTGFDFIDLKKRLESATTRRAEAHVTLKQMSAKPDAELDTEALADAVKAATAIGVPVKPIAGGGNAPNGELAPNDDFEQRLKDVREKRTTVTAHDDKRTKEGWTREGVCVRVDA